MHQCADGKNTIADFIKMLKIDADLITRAGGVQDLVRPKSQGVYDSLIRDLAVSVQLHSVKNIYLINHEDCGAYADFKFASRTAELKQHSDDLKVAVKLIKKEFPGVGVKLYFAELAAGGFAIGETIY